MAGQTRGFNTSLMENLGSPIKLVCVLITVVRAVATAFAVDPPPDGGYPGNNTAEGDNALFSLSTGFDNTAVGFDALSANTIGFDNTAIGLNTLAANTSGTDNTAIGWQALTANITGDTNTAIGVQALPANTTGNSNIALGFAALLENTTGGGNVALGGVALEQNITGLSNTAVGNFALEQNVSGGNNVALGIFSLFQTTGSNNIGIGFNGGGNLKIGSDNIYLGTQGGPSKESKTIRIGAGKVHNRTYVAGIRGVTVADGVAVVIGADGQLGTLTSSARYKEAIEPMNTSSEAILSLKPVSFRYKHELDPQGIPQFGLVAEEVAKVDPDLVARDEEGKPYTVRYEAVNAMLLNEFLKEHRKVEDQSGEIADLRAAVLELQTALQKISNRSETNDAAR
jgi:hypothetical protein